MSNELATGYLSFGSVVRVAIFIIGAVLANLTTNQNARMGRLTFLGFLVALFFAAIIAQAAVGLIAPSFWTGPNADRLNSQDIPPVTLAYVILLISLEITISGATGFALWVIASRRSRDATGSNGWAIRLFLPIIGIVAFGYLLFKGSTAEYVGDDKGVKRPAFRT